MTTWSVAAATLLKACGDVKPVAVSYLETPPGSVEKFSGTVPSGCTFWRLAAEGREFYAVPADFYNCPIGSYTHAIDLPADRAGELEQTLGLMASLGYVRMEEVPSIPRLPKAPAATYFAPLAAARVAPDVVIASGRPAAVMRLQEAALRAGATSALPLLGRPTCMGLPAALAHGTVTSTGCIGNRVYTDLGDDELYVMIPGTQLAEVADAAATIASANQALADYHRERRQALSARG
jgi:uncharacterized protein (DUF169 family)